MPIYCTVRVTVQVYCTTRQTKDEHYALIVANGPLENCGHYWRQAIENLWHDTPSSHGQKAKAVPCQEAECWEEVSAEIFTTGPRLMVGFLGRGLPLIAPDCS